MLFNFVLVYFLDIFNIFCDIYDECNCNLPCQRILKQSCGLTRTDYWILQYTDIVEFSGYPQCYEYVHRISKQLHYVKLEQLIFGDIDTKKKRLYVCRAIPCLFNEQIVGIYIYAQGSTTNELLCLKYVKLFQIFKHILHSTRVFKLCYIITFFSVSYRVLELKMQSQSFSKIV